MSGIYGSSFDSLMQAEQNEQGMRQRAQQASLDRVDASMKFMAQQKMQQRQMAYQQAARQQEVSLQQQQLAEQHFRDANMERRYDTENTIRQQQADTGASYTKWLTSQDSPTAERKKDFSFKAASDDASQGRFATPKDVKRVYPDLTDEVAQLMADRSVNARPHYELGYQIAANSAGVLNRRQELQDKIDAAKVLTDKEKNRWMWNDPLKDSDGKEVDFDALKQKVAAYTAEMKHLPNPADPRFKGMTSAVTQGEDGRYYPAVSKPPWLDDSQKDSGIPRGGAKTQDTGDDLTGGASAMPRTYPGGGGNLQPNQPAPQAPSAGTKTVAPLAGRNKYSPAIYSRASQLVNTGMQPPDALRQALGEQDVFGQPIQ